MGLHERVTRIAWLFVLFSFRGSYPEDVCPEFCVCDSWYQLERASCVGRHLYSVQTGVGSFVQALDLSNNSVSSLNSYELLNAGLKRLKYLNLSGNAISEINLNAFAGLDLLMVVDLSRNRLRYMLEDMIAENEQLQILRLSGNNFDPHVPKLRSSSLMTFSLDSCKISHLPQDTFNGLRNIRSLDLSGNLMIQVDSVTFRPLPLLRELSLERNPWSCNQAMLEFRSYLLQRGVRFASFCVKSPAPKKSEKMILPPMPVKPHVRRPVKVITNQSDVPQKCPELRQDDPLSSLWFLTAGFLLGASSGTFICYLWLTRLCQTPLEEPLRDPQRLSLLSSLWWLGDPIQAPDGDVSCPGTPPPPYREVMLRPDLYRNSGRNCR